MSEKRKAKPKYEVAECVVCDWWSNTTGCFKDRTEEFGGCLFQVKDGEKDEACLH